LPRRRWHGLWYLARLALGLLPALAGCGGKAGGNASGANGSASDPGKGPGGLLPAAQAETAGEGASGDAGAKGAPRPVFDLVANRVHGVEYQDGRLVIDAGSPAFLKFVDGGWKTSWYLEQKDEGRAVALTGGVGGIVFFPVDDDGDGIGGGDGARMLTVALRSLVDGQRVSVFVNEQAVGTAEVPTTFGTLSFTVPAKLLTPGENRLRFAFKVGVPMTGKRRSAAAIAQLTLGPAPAPGAVIGRFALKPESRTIAGSTRRGFALGGPGRLSFFLQIPRDARLQLAYAAEGADAPVLVRLARDGAASRVLFEGTAKASGYSLASLDLGGEAGRAVRIDLVGKGKVIFAEPRIAVSTPVATPLPEKHFDHIFVWMVDTLRADKVHTFNPKTRVETPNYDAFAADGVKFAWAQVPGTWSLPSHSSILTGVYPSVHGGIAHKARLSPDVAFIAEQMKKGGYRTGLFSSNGYVSSKWGFDRGWDETRNFIRESLPNGADYLWKTARTWMDGAGNRGKPKFLYLATVEPHVIYNPKKEFLARYWKKPYTGPIKPAQSGVQLGYIKSGKLKVDDTDKAYLEALHDAEITQSDASFGKFIADLKARKLYDTSAIIVISDHGDEFWEHGDVGHAQGVYQELVHIPLIIRAPGLLPTGHVVNNDVEAMDLFPTLLELAGLPVPAATQGASLLPLIEDEAAYQPRVSLTQNLALTRGIKLARYRLVMGGLGRVEIYDELEDPREQKNLAATHPIALRQLRNVFGLLYANEDRWRKRTFGSAANLLEAFYGDSPAL
jgi:choline-sulfatase